MICFINLYPKARILFILTGFFTLLFCNVNAHSSTHNSNLDSDNDGMLDSWEQQYGLNYLHPDDANSDLDKDNVLAIDEFLNGTVPHASLDIDGNGEFDALTDGLQILRSFFGITNDALISDAVGDNSSYNNGNDYVTGEQRVVGLNN